jgi:pimeloyl-ACP methyl ester carboxylesterase
MGIEPDAAFQSEVSAYPGISCISPGRPYVLHCFPPFETDLTEEHRRHLAYLVERIRHSLSTSRPVTRVIISGHSARWHQTSRRLLEERARQRAAVAAGEILRRLRALGIAERVQVEYLGLADTRDWHKQSYSSTSGSQAAQNARALNRRVEVTLARAKSPKPDPAPPVVPDGPDRERVVFIPGFMGSRLLARGQGRRQDRFIWDPPHLAGIKLTALRKLGNGYDTGGPVVPRGPINFGDVYDSLLERLRQSADLLAFAYDWRLSNAVNAARLDRAIRQRWSFEAGRGAENKVSIISHSMGGLIARHYVESGTGVPYVKRLVAIGVPNLGVPEAFLGMRMIGRPAFRFSLKNFASVVEMLPAFPFATAGDRLLSLDETYAILERRLVKAPIKSGLRRLMHARGLTVHRLLTSFRQGLISNTDELDSWLQRRGIRYDFLASTGLETETRFRLSERSGLILRVLRTTRGDDTVPLHSALMGEATSRHTNIDQQVLRNVKHRLLCAHRAVQAHCLSVLRSHRKRSVGEVG